MYTFKSITLILRNRIPGYLIDSYCFLSDSHT